MKTLEKRYMLIYIDKKNNELDRQPHYARSIEEAREYAKAILTVSLINDLKRIRVTLEKTTTA